ncbi:MAG TPA: glycosyltransferase family 4 protein, partial [Gemmatimonadales bacterium]|nr:glycosyltransferase family 4 protein [Gemmatimonadales bacterium]
MGHEVVVVTGGLGPFTDELASNGIPYVALPHLCRAIHPADEARALYEIRSALQHIRPQLISTHSSKAGWLGRLAAWSLGIPVIFTAHGWSFTPGVPVDAARIYRWAERLAAPFADRIITVSHYDRYLALRHGIADESKIVTIHNGMPDVAPYHRAAPGRDPVRLVMVARFEEQKDHGTLLRALAPLADLAWELDLIGDGPLRSAMEQLAAELGIGDRVHFWGAQRDVASRLAAAQVFSLCSHWEGFPRSILEAMRAGLPVLATDVGGVRESLEDGVDGFLVPRGDEELIRLRLQQLIMYPELRVCLGENARARYEEEFTLERTLERTVAVYREVVAERQRLGNGRGSLGELGAGSGARGPASERRRAERRTRDDRRGALGRDRRQRTAVATGES